MKDIEKLSNKISKIKEGWSGPGRRDEIIPVLQKEDNALHIDLDKKGNFEWWYFDARLEGGYTAVSFFRAAHERTGKTGVELSLYLPNGEQIKKVVNYKRSDMKVSRTLADVKIGENYLKVDYENEELPTYEIFLEEENLSFHLIYEVQVKGWIPGKGTTEFGNMGYFGWCVPIPKAIVKGTIRIDDKIIEVEGLGYHDHNWGNIKMPRILHYWYWGRLYSDHFTMIYAHIQCNKKMDDHTIKVLMLAKDENIILSTGEYDLIQEDFHYDDKAANIYPKNLRFIVSNLLEISLTVQKIIDSGNILDYFEISPIIKFIACKILRLKPGYFRFNSNFNLKVNFNGTEYNETGSTLHEMVILKQLKKFEE